VNLDGRPIAPQQDGDRLLLDLPASAQGAVRDLQIVYETPVASLALYGNVGTEAPRLWLRADGDAKPREIETADVFWQLVLPEGHRLVRSTGTVFTSELAPRKSPVGNALAALYWLSGGVHPPIQAAREAARRTRSRAPQTMYQMDSSVRGYFELPEDMDVSDIEATTAEPTAAPEAPAVELEMELEELRAGRALKRAQEDYARERTTFATPIERPPTEVAGEPAAPAEAEPPPPTDQPAQPPVTRAPEDEAGRAVREGKYWALEGIRSLKIDLQRAGEEIDFQSLGVQPRLAVTIANGRRVDLVAWAVALAVLAFGVLLTCRSTRTKTKYVLAVAALALAVPLVTGLLHELGDTFDFAFYAACLLVPYYLVAGLIRWLSGCCCRGNACTTGQGAVGCLLVASALLSMAAVTDAWAQPPKPPAFDPTGLIELLAPPKPIELPGDAVIIPYDASEGLEGVKNAEKVLVPYEKYVELWNRAFPDRKIEVKPPVAAYSLAGAAYQATLSGDEQLLLTGHVDIDVYSEKPVQIPLRLEGGVLTSATIDGQPARLQILQTEPAQQQAQPAPQAANAPAQMRQQKEAAAAPDREFALLYLSGKGRKRLELSLRINLQRQGGWRLASGRLPTAPATALTLTVPAARTEVRLSGIADRSEYETEADNEQIATALGADGGFGIQWRPKVAEGEVDRSLTVRSEAVLDVQEDGLRLVWQLNLEFPRSRRDAFTVLVPAGYLVERVTGDNIRAWEVKPDDAGQRLDVTLLNEAVDRESVTLHVSRRGLIAPDRPAEFPAPAITVDGAVLHKGRLTIRRSPLLELRTTRLTGLSRTDIPSDAIAALAAGDAAEESPLGLRPYQAFEFGATTFSMVLAAAPVPSDATATVESVLRIAERETRLETRVTINVRSRPVHRLGVVVPATLKIEELSVPGEFTWAVTEEENRRVLSVYLAAGQSQPFPLVLRGSLGPRQAADPVPAPQLEVLDVNWQQGDIVVQIDPAFNVRAVGLQKCETILLSRTFGWLQPEQRPLARLALRYFAPGYEARFEVQPRPARVNGYTITNVKVTDVAVEETIIVDLTIREAGIRELSFLLPAWMERARVSAPMLRQKTIEDAAEGWKRFRLQLQDELTGQYRVLVEHDRVLRSAEPDESEPQEAPVPVLETGRTDQRFVTLENVGRDEVVFVDVVQLSPLGRQQAQWRKLAAILGEGITTAYLVEAGAASPRLTFKTKQRKTVETAGAKIGLGETLLVVDANGAYRGEQTYHVNNTTEQYLVVRLPAGAQLWTATVSGEPVKPTEVPNAPSPDQVRIPLIKTAEGDPDYPVVLKYGGHRSGPVKTVGRVSFPLIRTVNINVELSRVRLRLPETHRWFNFGGTMRRVFEEGEYQADFFLYNTRQVKRLKQVWDQENPYARARVVNNLKQLGLALQNYSDSYKTFMTNESFRKNFQSNEDAVKQLQQQTEAFFDQQAQVTVEDNRRRLNQFWMDQKSGLARNVVVDLGGNFGVAAPPDQAKPQAGKDKFNYDWLARNQLENKKVLADDKLADRFGKMPQKGVGEKLDEYAKNQMLLGDLSVLKEAHGKTRGELVQAEDQQRLSQSQRALARQYQQRLEEEAAGQQIAQQPPPAVDRNGDGRAPEVRRAIAGVALGEPSATGGPAVTVQPQGGQAAAVESHLASLDVDLPQRGVEFLFTTPRGDIEITGRAVSAPLISRLVRLLWIVVGLVVLVIVYRLLQRIGPPLVHSMWAAALLLLAGLFSVLFGLFAIVGLLALVVGLVQLVRLAWSRRRRTAPAAP
jgi:hypothetical protein